MTLWSMFRSPLMFGGNLPKTSEFTISLISNEEVLEVNQNSWNNRLLRGDVNQKIWVAENEKGIYVALFNISDEEREITFNFSEVELSGKQSLRDVWKKEDLFNVSDGFTAKVVPHGAKLYLISK